MVLIVDLESFEQLLALCLDSLCDGLVQECQSLLPVLQCLHWNVQELNRKKKGFWDIDSGRPTTTRTNVS